jgi:hypothetical protein
MDTITVFQNLTSVSTSSMNQVNSQMERIVEEIDSGINSRSLQARALC